MKILVTGAAGQLGRELHDALEEGLPGVSIYTDIQELDLTDAKAVSDMIEQGDFTHIVNCAAFTAVDQAEQDQTMCYRINAEAVRNIASAASRAGVKVIHISTDYVFDGRAHRPYRESDKVNPVSHYGTSKRKGEMVLLSLCPDAVIIRTAWLYSPYGHNFVKTMLDKGIKLTELRVVSDQIGTPTYAPNLAQAILAILKARQWVEGIFHFTDEGVCSWYDFTKAIFRIAGIGGCKVTPITTEDYPTPAVRPPYSVLDKTAIKKTYGITIPHWEESLERCIARLKSGSVQE
ncbi:MAG: dTDP-4-dehydrorhamnose reductase [Muribaculaceae bacterium]|nr:dTDP-4-dehydrorhamnose reductase [Muribaculaceae bacterium]